MRRQLREKLDRVFGSCKGIDRIVLVNTSEKDPNFTYLTGFKGGLFEESILLADRKGLTLFTSSLEYETALKQRFDGLRIVDPSDPEAAKALLSGALKGKRIGINGSFLPYSKYLSLRKRYRPKRIADVNGSFMKARLVKSAEEIASIREAARITRTAQERILKYLRAGITERSVAREFDDISEGLGSGRPSFDTIVCFGKNASLPHHMPDDTKLKAGDFVLIDAGATVGNYCSDMTRTSVFGGAGARGRGEKAEMLRIVKEAQGKAIRGIRPGKKGSEIDGIARSYLDTVDKGKYKGRFIHALGHSVGIEVHDGEGFSPGSKLTLKENMVITVEPGVYVPDFGGVRFEDDILITKKGCKII
jgi:Xaa-Pro dipeptidase